MTYTLHTFENGTQALTSGGAQVVYPSMGEPERQDLGELDEQDVKQIRANLGSIVVAGGKWKVKQQDKSKGTSKKAS